MVGNYNFINENHLLFLISPTMQSKIYRRHSTESQIRDPYCAETDAGIRRLRDHRAPACQVVEQIMEDLNARSKREQEELLRSQASARASTPFLFGPLGQRV